MLGFGRLTLKQAREEIEHGRLEEAYRLLTDPAIKGHRGVGAMLARLGRGYITRGQRKLRRDDAEGAWSDLLQAERIGGAGAESGGELRQALTRLGLAEVRALLKMGDPVRAEESAARLRTRGVQSGELGVLHEIIRGWLTARELASQGELGRALEPVQRIQRLLAFPLEPLQTFQRELEENRDRLPGLLIQLHEASDAGHWRDAIEISEQILRIAPSHPDARKARGRAWKAVEPITVPHRPVKQAPVASPSPPPDRSPRFLLWIDGVGGYLVCQGHRLTLGQASIDGGADLPLIADVARLHAVLSRDAEGYLLEALRPVKINGQTVSRALLRSGDRITLGESCQLVFHQPVPISTSARLDVVSGQRLPMALDGILLMADTLIVGSGPQAHVSAPDLQQPMVLFRQKPDAEHPDESLGLRYPGSLTVNGKKVEDKRSCAILGDRATVVTDELTLAIEPANL